LKSLHREEERRREDVREDWTEYQSVTTTTTITITITATITIMEL
jgi:hypothetical protein